MERVTGSLRSGRAKAKELEPINTELAGQQELWAKNLITISKYTAIQREAARLDGERAMLIAEVARAKGRIAETELQIIQLDQDLKAEVSEEICDIQAKEAELRERRVAAEDQLKRVDIRAPQSGTVHQLAVHTVGGVIAAGEPIMLIVPSGDTLVIEAMIAPQDIDHVRHANRRSCASQPSTRGHARIQRCRLARVGGPDARAANRPGLLRRTHRPRRRRAAASGQLAARSRHAGRGPDPHIRAHRSVLSNQAPIRPDRARFQGGVSVSPRLVLRRFSQPNPGAPMGKRNGNYKHGARCTAPAREDYSLFEL